MLVIDETFKFKKRHRLSPVTDILDIADYKIGYIFSIWSFITIIKLKTSKIMEAPRYVTLIKIFNTEYQKT
jgi:hypothetical protein